MNILFTRFPLESAFGGAEIQTLTLMEGLIKKGHSVAFLGSCPVLLRECRARKITCASLTIGPPPVTKWGAITFAWRKKRMQARLETALAQFPHLDAVCMLSLSEKILMTESLSKKNVTVLWIEHDRVGRWLAKNPWLAPLRRAALCAMTICVSELSRNIYLNLGWPETHAVAIPNGIDLTRFGKETHKHDAHGSSLRVGCVARLSHEKGIDVLTEAAAGVPELDLTIVGSGREEGYVRTLIDGIQEREHLGDARMRIVHAVPDLGEFYRSLDVLVLPSREHDPFGLVAAEAMSVGTPVIVTDACGIAGYLEHEKDALIVKADSVSELRGALTRMMDSTHRKNLAENGKKTAEHVFAASSMIDSYETLIVGAKKSRASA